MTVKTNAALDLETLRRGYAEWDVVGFRSGDREETFEAGDAYYRLTETLDVVTKNVKEMDAASS
jgi:hypothetical protein